MTLYHAINVIALASLPIYFTYKFSANLSEYGGIARCLQVGGFYYIYTQIVKMLLLTFFPSQSSDTAFFLSECLSSVIDIFGLFYALRKLTGKGHMKLLQVAIGWSCAETVFTRGLSLWQAKGVEFAWSYTQKALDSNIAFVETMIIVCLVWSLDRHDLNKKYIIQIWTLIAVMVLAKPAIMTIDPWTKLLMHCGLSAAVGIPTMYIYSSMPNSNY